MFKIEIITVGKIKSAWIREGAKHYAKLVSKFADVKIINIKEGDNAHLPEEKVLSFEAERIREKLAPRAMRMILDVNGRQFSSPEFARFLERGKMEHHMMQFIIGGAFGVDDSIKAACDLSLSLSPMTFPHELTQVILLEQLYRAFSISSGTKYHK